MSFFAPLLDGLGTANCSGLPVLLHHGHSDDPVNYELNVPPIKRVLEGEGAVVRLLRLSKSKPRLHRK